MQVQIFLHIYEGPAKSFVTGFRIISLLRFIKHIFITNLQSIPPLLKHIFVNFLPSREKQINSLLLVSVGDTKNSAAKRTSRRILVSRKKAFSLALEIKRSHRDSGTQVGRIRWMV